MMRTYARRHQDAKFQKQSKPWLISGHFRLVAGFWTANSPYRIAVT
jgi:hypothetical protein